MTSEELALRITGDSAGAQQAASGLGDKLKGLGDALGVTNSTAGQLALGLATGTLAVETLHKVAEGLTDFLKESLTAWSNQELALRRVSTAMTAQGLGSKALVKANIDIAEQFARTTVYADEELETMEALLIQIGNVAPAQMGAALEAATDLASGLGIDLRSATLLVGKAFAGETDSMKRYGIVLDETDVKARGVAAVLDAIHGKFGGQAQAEVQTYAGQVKQTAKAYDELQESVGRVVASLARGPMSALRAALTAMTPDLKGPAEPKKLGDSGKLDPSLLPSWAAAFSPLAAATADFTKEVRAARAELDQLSPTTIANIRAAKELGQADEEVGKQFHLSADATKVLSGYLADLTKQQEKAKQTAKELAEADKKRTEEQAKNDADLLKSVSAFLDGQAAAEDKAAADAAKARRERLAGVAADIDAEGDKRIDMLVKTGLAGQDAEKKLQLLYATGREKRVLELQFEWEAKNRELDQLDHTAVGYQQLRNDTDAYYSRLIQQETSAKVVLQDLFGAVSQLGRGLQSAGDLLQSHFLSGLGKALDMFQRMVSTVNDLFSSIKNISGIIANLSGGGGGGGGAAGKAGGYASTAKTVAGLFGIGGSAAAVGGAAAIGGTAAGTLGGTIAATSGLSLGGTGLSGVYGTAASNAGIGVSAGTIAATGGIAAGVIAAYLAYKKWFGHGAIDRINKFGDQFGPGGLNQMQAIMFDRLGYDETVRLWHQKELVGKNDDNAAKAWQADVLATFVRHGVPLSGFKMFKTGGLDDFGHETIAALHGREAIVPLDKLGQFMTAAEKASVGGRSRGAGGASISVAVDARGATFRDRESIRDLAELVVQAIAQRYGQLDQVPIR